MSLEADRSWADYKNFSDIVLNYTHDTINWYWNKGILNYIRNQYKEASMDFNNSNNPLHVADCQLHLGDTAKAYAIIHEHIAHKERSWSSKPGSWADFRISYDLALANILLGNSEDACQWVKISLEEGRDFFYQIITNEVIIENISLPACIDEILEAHRKDIETRSSGYKYW